MFDIGFWELCLIAVISLIVFGPEKLPQVARKAGLWVGKVRRIVASVKQEIDRELRLEEMKEAIRQTEQNSLHQFLEETKTSLSELNLNQPVVTETPSGTEKPGTDTASVLNSPNKSV